MNAELKRLPAQEEKREPRNERWIAEHDQGLGGNGRYETVFKYQGEAHAYATSQYPKCVPVTHFIELRPGESLCEEGSVCVSREKLAAAWDKHVPGSCGADPAIESHGFKGLCEEIGLGEK